MRNLHLLEMIMDHRRRVKRAAPRSVLCKKEVIAPLCDLTIADTPRGTLLCNILGFVTDESRESGVQWR